MEMAVLVSMMDTCLLDSRIWATIVLSGLLNLYPRERELFRIPSCSYHGLSSEKDPDATNRNIMYYL